MAERPQPRLALGDIAPAFQAPEPNGSMLNLADDSVSGKPQVLVFLRDAREDEARRMLAGISAWSDRLSGLGCETLLILPLTPPEARACQREQALPFRILCDPAGEITRRMTPQLFEPKGPPAVTVVLRPNRHVMAVLEDPAADHGDLACAHIETLAAERAHRQAVMHPPVLMVPDVLSPDDCQRLITIFAMQGNEYVEPGHGTQGRTQDYKMRIPDYGRNDRVDHWVINPETTNFIAQKLGQRVIPEIKKAFHYQITKYERFRIGRYQAAGGSIIGAKHGHRDNTQPQVAYRRFACSVNLNSEAFEGGGLIFPEFSGHEYAPRTGEALIFSSSLLHEVRPVTKGTRYAVLSFLYGDV